MRREKTLSTLKSVCSENQKYSSVAKGKHEAQNNWMWELQRMLGVFSINVPARWKKAWHKAQNILDKGEEMGQKTKVEGLAFAQNTDLIHFNIRE